MKIKFLALLFNIAFAFNILPNPSFEVWVDTLGVELPLGWLTSEFIRPGSAVRSTSSRTGNFCVNLIGLDTAAFITTTTIVRPGKSYFFSGWAKTGNILAGFFSLQFLTLLGSPLGNPILLPVYRATDYRNYTTWITAPESAVFVAVALLTLANTNLFVDDVTLEDTSLAKIEEEKEKSLMRQGGISFFLKYPQRVKVEIYDVLGKEVRRCDLGLLPAGSHKLEWDRKDSRGRNLPAGTYFIKVLTEERDFVSKVLHYRRF